MPFDPSTATVDEAPPVAAGFDPSSAQFTPKPEVKDKDSGTFDAASAHFGAVNSNEGFDPATAHFTEEATLSSAPEEGWLHKAYRKVIREPLSPIVGPTEEQQAEQEFKRQGLAKMFPSIARQAEETGSDVEKKGLTPALFGIKTPWSLPTNDEPVRKMSSEYFEALLTPKDETDPKSLKIAKALYTPIAHSVNAMTSPVGLMTMGGSSALKSITTPRSGVSLGSELLGPTKVGGEGANLAKSLEGSVAAIFAADMGRSLGESAPGLIATIKDPNAGFQEKLQASVELSLNAAFVLAAGHGAYKGLKPDALTGKTQAQKVDILAEASGKTHEEVIQEVQGNFDELLGNVGKPESVLAQEKRIADLRAEFKAKEASDGAHPDLATATESNESIARRTPIGSDLNPIHQAARATAHTNRRQAAVRVANTLQVGDRVGDFIIKRVLRRRDGAPEFEIEGGSGVADLAVEIQNGEPILRAKDAEKIPADGSDWRYEILDTRNEQGERNVNVTRVPPDGGRGESRPLQSWLSEGHDIPGVPEGHPRGNFSAEEVRDNAQRAEELTKSHEEEQLQMALDQMPEEARSAPEFGLGAATAEEMTPKPSITGIKNADIDADRVARGLQPLMDTARRSWGKVWDQAMERIDSAYRDGEDAASEIIARQLDKPESLSDIDQAILLHRRVDLKNQYERVARRLIEGHEVGNEVTIAADRQRIAQLEDQLNDLEQANKVGGAESGRGLAARKMMAREDFSLVNMRLRKRANKGGAPLTPKESAEVEAAHKKIVEAQKELDLHTEGKREAESTQAADEAVETLKKDVEAEDPTKANDYDLDKERDRAIDNIRKRAEEDAPIEDLTAFIRKLAENFVRRGVNERGALVTAVHDVVKDIVPEMTPREVMDAISGYGDFTPLDPDVVKAQLRELKGQMQQVAKLEDMQKGQAPLASGRQRPTPGDLWRALIKQVNEMKRKGGFNVTDPVKQLKTALESIKTRLTNQIADLTHQIDTRTRIVKTKTAVKLDAEAEALTKQRDALKEQFDQIFQKPDLTDAQRLALAEKAADRQIVELERQIRMQEVFPAGKAPELKSAALDAKRARIEALKEEREYVRETLQPKEDPKTEAEKKVARLDKQIEDLQKQIDQREVFPKGKKPTETSPEIEAKQKQLAELREAREALRDEIQPDRFNDRRLGALKSRLTNRIAELQERLANSDFGPRPKSRPIEMDAEAETLQAAATRAKQEFDTALLKDRLANRSKLQKAKDTFVKWQRGFLLSGPVTLAKLTAAAGVRMASSFAEEAVGGVISKLPLIHEVAKRAPSEGGFSIKAEAKAVTSALTQGMRDSWQTLKTGRSDLDVNYGKGADGAVRESDVLPRSVIDFFGALHGALKAPVKRAAFERSLQKRIEHYLRNNADLTDPAVQMKAMIETFKQEAYKDSLRSIFLQDNVAVEAINAFITRLERPLKSTGKPSPFGTVGAGVARGLFPIVRVPMNIVAETVQYATGLITGSARLANAFRKGVEKLSPDQADLIMRDLKKGVIGTTALILGYVFADDVGGYYTGEKRKKTDAKFGSIKLFGHNIPSYLLHSPLLEVLQIGATIRHVLDKKVRGADQSLGYASWIAALGLADETPFGHTASTVARLLDPKETMRSLGEITKSTVVPQLVSQTASFLDQDSKGTIPRKAEGPIEAVESGIPGLRQTLPVDQRKANRR